MRRQSGAHCWRQAARAAWTGKGERGASRGRETLARQREQGPTRKLVGLTVEGRAVARQGYPLRRGGRPGGGGTSGAVSPTLQVNIALGYVPRDLAAVGAELEVEVRGHAVPVRVTRLPFYRARK